jgi:L-ascorbate metabolism protein UlaG (beta-lactamase superfamily)
LLAAWGLPAEQVREMRAGDRLDLGHFEVEVLPARHLPLPGFGCGPLDKPVAPPRRARDYRMDACFSFHLRVGGLSLLDWTSQRPTPAPRADLLLVKLVGSRRHFRRLLAAVRPSLVMPLHWDNPFRPVDEPAQPFLRRSRWLGPLQRQVEPQRFAPWLEVLAPGVEVLVPEMGRAYDVGALLDEGCP